MYKVPHIHIKSLRNYYCNVLNSYNFLVTEIIYEFIRQKTQTPKILQFTENIFQQIIRQQNSCPNQTRIKHNMGCLYIPRYCEHFTTAILRSYSINLESLRFILTNIVFLTVSENYILFSFCSTSQQTILNVSYAVTSAK